MTKELSDQDIEKIAEALSGIRSQFAGSELSEFIKTDNQKLIECRHEIVIDVVAQVYEENETGETIASKEISKKSYHIPVPSNKDYKEYLIGFFNFLENCMLKSIQENEGNTNNE